MSERVHLQRFPACPHTGICVGLVLVLVWLVVVLVLLSLHFMRFRVHVSPANSLVREPLLRFLHNPFFSTDLTDPNKWQYVASPRGSMDYIINRLIMNEINASAPAQHAKIRRLSSTQQCAMLTQAPFLEAPNQRHLVSKMSCGVIHEQQIMNTSLTGLPPTPKAAVPPQESPKVRRSVSTPTADVPEFPAGSSGINKAHSLAAPRSLTRRKSSVSVFWFFAMSKNGNAVEVHGGGIDDMNKRYHDCPSKKVKWKALVNVSSNNIKKPG